MVCGGVSVVRHSLVGPSFKHFFNHLSSAWALSVSNNSLWGIQKVKCKHDCREFEFWPPKESRPSVQYCHIHRWTSPYMDHTHSLDSFHSFPISMVKHHAWKMEMDHQAIEVAISISKKSKIIIRVTNMSCLSTY